MLLDLLNTTPVVDGAATDVLADDAAARAWLRAHGGGADRRTCDGVREVRDDLQRVVRGDVDPVVLRPLPRRRCARCRRFAADGVDVGARDAADWRARVVLAWGEVQTDMPGRLRPCANDECQAVPARPQPRRHRPVVLDERVRQPDEGAPSLPPDGRD